VIALLESIGVDITTAAHALRRDTVHSWNPTLSRTVIELSHN
jgi:hypothetical protein